MIETKEVENLAELAKIELAPTEKEQLRVDLEAVLGYVSQLNDAPIAEGLTYKDDNINVFREDGVAHESGINTDKLLAEAPKTKDNYVVVKQIMKEKS